MKTIKHSLLAAFAFLPLSALHAQNVWERSLGQIRCMAETQFTASDGQTPLWLASNRYGLSSLETSNGYLRAGLFSEGKAAKGTKWNMQYGIDLVLPYHFTSDVVVQQLYADLDYRLLRLTVGAKEQPMAFRNNALSSGSQTLGINARPVPEVRLGLPTYWNIAGRGHWAAIRGHISYGVLTDGAFQKSYVAAGENHAEKVRYHSKAGYLRLGNEDKFPVTFEGGLEMVTTFGGTVYNALGWDGVQSAPIHLPSGFKDYLDATLGLGGDTTDGNGYANASGNTLGSWLFRLNYKGKGWRLGLYYDHFFEDHSQMFFEYGWYDGLWGIDLQLDNCRWITALTYEYLNTTYQSGPVYHDQTPQIPDQISGVDNYYNHNLYPGHQHWGQAIGNPLYPSPLYARNGSLTFTGNRFKAHHFGIQGQPTPAVGYRLLYSHERNLGTWAAPFDCARKTDSFLAEVRLTPERIGRMDCKGWQLGMAFAPDRGSLVGDNTGFQITLSKTFAK